MLTETDFWRRVDIRGPNECWPWKLSRIKEGYGQWWFEGKNWKAHRLAWFFTYGKLPQHRVLHKCDNKVCCNPADLYDGTDADNVRDAFERGQRGIGERHPRAKLTDAQVSEIRRRALTEKHTPLAAEFGITYPYLWNLVTGRKR